MNSVEKVKALCKERKIPISRLEKDLGYGNGYIGQLKKGTLPDDRLVEIANYLNVSTAYFTGKEQNKPATPEGSELTPKQRKAYNMIKDLPDDQMDVLIAMAEALVKKMKL